MSTYSTTLAFGAGNESRTRDLNLGKVALYQLSYSRVIPSLKAWHFKVIRLFRQVKKIFELTVDFLKSTVNCYFFSLFCLIRRAVYAQAWDQQSRDGKSPRDRDRAKVYPVWQV